MQGEGRGTLKEKMKPNPLLISHRPVVDEVEAKRGIKPISKLQFVKHVDSMLKKERMSDHPSRVEGSFSFQFEVRCSC